MMPAVASGWAPQATSAILDDMSLALLLVGLTSFFGTFVALVRVRHPAMLSFIVMMAGWLVGELAVFHLLLQAVVALGLVAAGGLDETRGWIGLAALGVSWIGLVRVQIVAGKARGSIARDLAAVIGDTAAVELGSHRPSLSMLARPFHHDRSGLEISRDVAYGPESRHQLDLYRLASPPDKPRPVMIYVHGGAWIIGKKEQQALPMIHALAKQGWLVVPVRYGLAPRHRFPTAITDVERAVGWVADHAEELDADPNFIAISGGSAGGHLAALAALGSAVGHRIAACVPIYGAFDFTDSQKIRGYASMRVFLERAVMPTKLADDREGWEAASPIFRVDTDAPPFLVVHGTHDVLLWREETRSFVAALREASSASVTSVEVPGAQHAFDLFHSVRSAAVVDGIITWLEAVRATRSEQLGRTPRAHSQEI
jgi:acetyl esterase/lipase